MRLSVTLPEREVSVLDRLVESAGLPSRAAAVKHAIRLVRLADLGQDYAAAWDEWNASGQEVWDSTVADGVVDASP